MADGADDSGEVADGRNRFQLTPSSPLRENESSFGFVNPALKRRAIFMSSLRDFGVRQAISKLEIGEKRRQGSAALTSQIRTDSPITLERIID